MACAPKGRHPPIACRGGCTLWALLCHSLSRPARPPQICRALRMFLFYSAGNTASPAMQGSRCTSTPRSATGSSSPSRWSWYVTNPFRLAATAHDDPRRSWSVYCATM